METWLETAIPWKQKAKPVDTKNGPRLVYKCKLTKGAPHTEMFWTCWRNMDRKKAMVITGISVGKEWGVTNGEWEVTWWRMPAKEVLEHMATSLEASVAIDAGPDFIISVPEGLAPLPFQRGGVHYAMQRKGTLIADDMGLGKTIQAICFINCRPEIKKVVIVVPASIRINWYRELNKWLTRPFNIRIAEPTWWPQADIVICNYDIIHRFEEQLTQKIDLAIADEAQNIKNPTTKRGQAVLTLGKSATYRLALTGTPMENGEEEVFTIAQFCDPETYNNRFMFKKKYCGDAVKRANLQRKLRSTIMVRRLKTEVLKDLPMKFRKVIELPYEDEELKEFERQATRKISTDRMEELKAALELAKASDNFADYDTAIQNIQEGCSAQFEMMAELRHRTALATLPYAIDHLRMCFEELKIPKIVFFCHHRDVSDAVHAAFPHSVQHYGGMDDMKKQAAVDGFQLDPHVNLFVGSIRASGVGITLTAGSHCVFGEFDWVPGRMVQAEDREHRIGQKDNVTVDFLVLEGSFTATMAKRIVEKQNAIDQALDADRDRLMKEPIVVVPEYKPKAPKPISASRAEMVERSATMSPSTIAAVHECLRILSGVCDGALALDDAGFNGCDSRIGKSLANQSRLSPLQAVLGQKLVRKYRRQLGGRLIESALHGSKVKDEDE